MKLRDMLKLMKDCDFMVRDLDNGLRTDCISNWNWNTDQHPQLKTLLDKAVVSIRVLTRSDDVMLGKSWGMFVLEVQ